MHRAFLNIAISLALAIACGVVVAKLLDINLLQSARAIVSSDTENLPDTKYYRYGRAPDINAVYLSLVRLDVDEMYRIRATDNLCQNWTFDCKGLSRSAVLTLIDGIIKGRDDRRSQNTLTVSLFGFVLSIFSFIHSVRKKS